MSVNSNGYLLLGGNIRNIYILLLLSLLTTIWGQNNCLNTFGNAYNDFGHAVLQTSDGGYVIAGASYSLATQQDAVLYRFNSSMQLTNTTMLINFNYDDIVNDMQQTPDGGYISLLNSFNGTDYDTWVIKFDTSLEIVWTASIGIAGSDDFGNSIGIMLSGGYLVCGTIYDAINHDYDIIVWGITPTGTATSLYEENDNGLHDFGNYAEQTSDGGIIIIGTQGDDISLIKLISDGDSTYSADTGFSTDGFLTTGTANNDEGLYVQQLYDGSYIIVGNTQAGSGQQSNVYINTITNAGDPGTAVTMGGAYNEEVTCVRQTEDGGFIFTGSKYGQSTMKDVWVVKLTAALTMHWAYTYGGDLNDHGQSIAQTYDGGYVVTGSTMSYGNQSEILLLRLDNGGFSECTGCTDPEATNYNPDATEDDGSCEYLDIEAILSFGEVDLASQTIEINLENTAPVSGFQFLLSSDDSVGFVDAYGGSSEENGFSVGIGGNDIVLGYSLSASEIPTGSDVLTFVEFYGFTQNEICLSEAVITSGYEDAEFFDVGYGDCISLYSKGDVNMDGLLNVLDVVTIVNIIFETIDPDEYEVWASDFNNDGYINIMDIVQIINVIFSDEVIIEGCMDATACNYNPDANVEGDCEYLDCMGECSMIMSGCMLQDAPNYCVSAILPCTTNCVNGQMGSNCCCEEIIYGCLDEGAINYSETANAPCVELVDGIETPNACCIESITGCTDQGASNYNPLATVEDNSQCTYDDYGCMNQEACNYNLQATLDCNAENAENAGSEWVQDDACCDLTYYTTCYLDLNNNGYYEEVNSIVSVCDCGEFGVGWVNEDTVNGLEVQGCTQVIIDGQVCPEYDPSANVNNGSCCLTEVDDDDENWFDFIGAYNVDFAYGMLNNNGECIADTMMEMGGPDIAQITLGPPDPNGVGQMQYFEQSQYESDSYPDFEFHVAEANTEDECMLFSEENGSVFYYCANWSFDYENCEDFANEGDCPMDHCYWETQFCFPTFQGQPCHELANDMDCLDNGCEWGADPVNPQGGHCFTPFDEPWMHCWDLDEYDCEMSPDCELEGSDDFDPGGGNSECMEDCPPFPDENNWTQEGECDWLSEMIETGCLSDCDDTSWDWENISNIHDMLEMQFHLLCNDTDGDCVGFVENNNDGFIGGDQSCISDCDDTSWDWENNSIEDSPEEFCNYIVPLYEGTCTDDCTGEEGIINCFGHICTGCLNIGNGICDEIFGNGGDGMTSLVTKLSQAPKSEDRGLSRGSACEEGYLEDCSGDGDCCDEIWLGDGYADCQDQEFGCDLSCYDNDGGDCESDFGVQACVPSSECFDYDYEGQCIQNNCDWVDDPFSNESHCEPMSSFNPNACGGMPEVDCIQNEECQWNATAGPNDPPEFEPHCGPKAPDDCFAFESASECDASISCEWDTPDWMEDWATGACLNSNTCTTPEYSDPDACYTNPACIFDWEYYECVEAGSGNNFCECYTSHTEGSCENIGGSWQLPDWAEGCEDCDWVENECMVPMSEQDCFHEYYDPCAQFFGGGNEHTDWDEATHTCTRSFSYSEAGTWGVNSDCFELNWEEIPEPSCSDEPLQTENTCFCFDCEWDESTGDCSDWSEDGFGRITDQAKMHDFQEMIYELSGSSGNRECYDYQVMDDGIIYLYITNEYGEYGDCQIIILSPVTSGT